MIGYFKHFVTSRGEIKFIKILVDWSGYLGAVCMVSLVIVTIFDVVMRYVFKDGSIGLQELEWHLFSAVFLLAAAHTLKCDQHVRLDLVYQSSRFTEQHRNQINIFGTLCFLIPFCIVIIIYSAPFALESFIHLETSPDPGGLSNRWIVKSIIPCAFVLILLQSVNDLIRRLKDKD
jgi:TRAP-type mannitol/chloroaromatic compound transport system permease small subunit